MKIETRGPVSFLGMISFIFVMFLFLSGSFEGNLSTIVYILSFILPILVGYKSSSDRNGEKDFLSLGGVKGALPFIAPTILIIMALSFVTTFIVTKVTGKVNEIDLGGSVALAIISHALVPALLEEALFRYIPMRVMKREKMIETVLWSSIFFSLIHHSFFSMPYAFFAGVIFMLLNLYTGSVWPSVIIHFINNALSVLWYFYGSSPVFVAVAISLLSVLMVASVIYIIRNREKYSKFVSELLSDKPQIKPTMEVWLLGGAMIIIAIMELFV